MNISHTNKQIKLGNNLNMIACKYLKQKKPHSILKWEFPNYKRDTVSV